MRGSGLGQVQGKVVVEREGLLFSLDPVQKFKRHREAGKDTHLSPECSLSAA